MPFLAINETVYFFSFAALPNREKEVTLLYRLKRMLLYEKGNGERIRPVIR